MLYSTSLLDEARYVDEEMKAEPSSDTEAVAAFQYATDGNASATGEADQNCAKFLPSKWRDDTDLYPVS